MIKKSLSLFFITLMVLSFAATLVNAYSYGGFYDPRQGMNDLIDITVNFFQPLLQVVLGGEVGGYDGYMLFEKLLLFLLLMSVVYLSLNKIKIFEDTPFVLWVVAIVVPLLGIRFLDVVWVNTILVQYKLLAIALTAALPFIIYFFFLEKIFDDNSTLRKIGWVFFACVYIGLWVTSGTEEYSAIYFWTALASIIFLFLDGTINRTIMMRKVNENQASAINQRIAELDQAGQLIETSVSLTNDEKSREKKKIAKQIAKLRKELA